MRMYTEDEYRYDTYSFSVQDVTSFVFMLQACHNGHIGLSSIPQNTETRTYEIVVGWNENAGCVLRLVPMGEVVQVGCSLNVTRPS